MFSRAVVYELCGCSWCTVTGLCWLNAARWMYPTLHLEMTAPSPFSWPLLVTLVLCFLAWPSLLPFNHLPHSYLPTSFSTKPTDWLGRTSQKWPVLCLVKRETLTQNSKSYLHFNGHFPGKPGLAGFPRFSSSTCSRRERQMFTILSCKGNTWFLIWCCERVR